MAERYVADTHALFWYLTGDARLSDAAREAIDRRRDGPGVVLVSVISAAELYYVNVKAGGPLDFRRELEGLVRAGIEVVPVVADDVFLFEELGAVPEMHDRIIAALAVRRGAALITRDGGLANAAGVPVVW
ncbi:MAG: type II toxin-antitoxin system VapC family toxin [Planctomycetota bacterium]|jgi:PIN domain nuclease of toxin-antitoxin system